MCNNMDKSDKHKSEKKSHTKRIRRMILCRQNSKTHKTIL